MPANIKVFICYEKVLAGGVRNKEADTLSYILKNDQGSFEPWFDNSISTGMDWERKIYSQLLSSDVLLVLIGKGTGQSEWVKREIALATALGIEVVPLGFDVTEDEMLKETKDLGVDRLQFERPRTSRWDEPRCLWRIFALILLPQVPAQRRARK